MKKHLILPVLFLVVVGCSPPEGSVELHTKRLYLEVKLAQGFFPDEKVFAELIGDDSAQSKALDLVSDESETETLIGSCAFLIGESSKRTLIINRDGHKSQRFLLPVPALPAAQGLTGWLPPSDAIDPGYAFLSTMHDQPVDRYQLPVEEQHAVRFRIEDWENRYR